VPASLIAALVLVTLFVPGYLFQYGVREYTNVLTPDRDVYAVAQAVAISAGILLAIFLALKVLSLDALKNSLLHDPASHTNRGLTLAQAITLVLLLALANWAGKIFGRTLSARRGVRLDRHQTPTGASRIVHGILDPFFSASPLDEAIDEVIRHAPVYVRIVRQGDEDVIGLVDAEAARASASPLGSGIALSSRWIYEANLGWRLAPGAHIPKTGMIELFWSPRGADRPPWLTPVLDCGRDRPEARPPERCD
jgi:hypothetical protein